MIHSRPLPLLGRIAERKELSEALERALAGAGGSVHLVGEPGIGKTRLADELAREAKERGALVAYGRATDVEGAPPYGLWSQVLSSRALRDRGIELRAEGDAADLGPARFDLLDGVARALRGAAEAKPLVLVLDDLHWADEPSVDLAAVIVRAIAETPLLVITTWRDADARMRGRIGARLEQIAREGRRLALAGLRAEEIGELVTDRDEARALARASGGNPFFLGELLSSGERGAMGGDVPEAARAAIRARANALPDIGRAVLVTAAELGPSVGVALLAAACDREREVILDALAAAVDAGLVRSSGDVIAFRHDLVREALRAEASAAERARVHERTAIWLERAPDAIAGDVAHHWLASQSPSRAIPFAISAADAALALHAYEAVSSDLTRVLSACPDAPAEARARMLLQIALACFGVGEREAGTKALSQAAAAAREAGDASLFAEIALARGLMSSHGWVDEELVGALREAIDRIAGRNDALEARVRARLASAMQPGPVPEDAHRMARDAIAIARRLADRSTLAAVLTAARGAFRPIDDLSEREAMDRECFALCLELGDRAGAFRARTRLVVDLLERGDIPAARALATGLDDDAVGRSARGEAALLTACFATMDGDAERAIAACNIAEELLLPVDPRAPMRPIELVRARLASWWGRRSELEAATPPSNGPPMRLMARALTEAELGRIDPAKAIWPMARPLLSADALFPRTMFAGLAMRLDDTEAAATLHRGLLAFADRHVALVLGMYEGPMERLLGLLALTMGNTEEAVTRLRRALSQVQSIANGPFAARIAEDLSRALEAKGDRVEAAKLRAQAAEAYARLGMEIDLERLAPSPERAEAIGPRTLCFTREGEVWTVEHAGRRCTLKDSDGLRYLAHLVAHPEEEVHVLELVALSRARGKAGAAPHRASRSAPVLDPRAKAAYRERLTDLRETLEEAESFGDVGRAERARTEIEALERELARALGLGGRDRKGGDDAERARVNLTQRIKQAVQRITEQDAELGAHLARSVRTGTTCRYSPAK